MHESVNLLDVRAAPNASLSEIYWMSTPCWLDRDTTSELTTEENRTNDAINTIIKRRPTTSNIVAHRTATVGYI